MTDRARDWGAARSHDRPFPDDPRGLRLLPSARADGSDVGWSAPEDAIRDGRPNSPIGVLVIDPQPHARRGLVASIERDPDLTLLGAAGDLAEIAPRTMRGAAVVVIEPWAAPVGERALIDAARRTLPGAAVVALTVQDDPASVERIRRAGASVVLSKALGVAEILVSIRGASERLRDRPGNPDGQTFPRESAR